MMKTFILSAGLLIAALSTQASDPTKSEERRMEKSRTALRREIRETFSQRNESKWSGGDIAYACFRTHADGSIELVQVNASEQRLRNYVAEQTPLMHLKAGEAIEGAEYSFKLRFEVH